MPETINIEICQNVQPQHRELLHSYLDSLRWLIPGWVNTLVVFMPDSLTDSDDARTVLAQVSINYPYRSAELSIATAWLDRDEAVQRFCLIHELIHLSTNLISDCALQAINALSADALNQTLSQQLIERAESATQDLAMAIQKYTH